MRESVADIVFARRSRNSKSTWLVAGIAAVVFHGGVLAFALSAEPTLEFWASELATRVHAELALTQGVTVAEETPPPPPQEPPPPPPKAPPPVAKAPPTAAPSTQSVPQAPAEAGSIIAAEASGPADLTGTTFVTGSAKAYAGGKTTAAGKSKEYVAPTTPTAPDGVATASYAESIALADDNWSCPWPHEADVADVNRQSAVVRVTVNATGQCVKAVVVKDPGMGFGAAAAACAMKAKFLPAKDNAGKAVASESAIRVRFER